ncbi:Pre-rRNA-processing protein [Lachnellula subtilissima]|uniref:18S rRNA factor 2 n=1 Tax=Lachnellula subtilissima TaxID=602034 RepID=A0A8H8RFI2_9HELO|nr:Pre-rRNA-processing protein [Lachnellula subtilissima]
MATRKLNDFLDADQSEDDGSQGYDSEIEDLKKGGRSPKRRKVDSDTDSSGEEDEKEQLDVQDSGDSEDLEDSKDTADIMLPSIPTSKRNDLPGVSKPLLTKKNLVASEAAIKRSGLLYISRVPPFMKPTKLRSLLEPYGAINRIFLTPEDPASHTRRVRNGGNKKRSFTDGWVEFVRKSHAKRACELLNGQIIGGKKGTYYHDDVWNLRYLNKYKWNHLNEQIAAENAARASRMRAEISKTTKENKEFVQNVERAKMLEGMEAKKAAKRRDDAEATSTTEERAPIKQTKKGGERPRNFKQTQVAVKKRPENQSDQVKRVLSSIF